MISIVIDVDYSDVRYFRDTNHKNFADFELEDEYSSEVYRGNGHLNVTEAATRTAMPGIEFRSET